MTPLFDFGLAAVLPADHGALLTFGCRCLADVNDDGTIGATVCCMKKLEEHSAAWRAGKAARAAVPREARC
jgi:hypothetical protein